MKSNNDSVALQVAIRNEYNVKTLTTTQRWASLVPAAAVIPAPLAYTKVVAVKKLVVGYQLEQARPGCFTSEC